MTDPRLERWLEALLATPGLTAISDPVEARRVHVEESLAAAPVLRALDAPVVDVGSGGGAPGIPLACALPGREVVLLESQRRKCDFLSRWVDVFPNLRVQWGRAEEAGVDWAGAAVAKALAPPVVAAEWCLPLVRPGGAAVLYVGPSAEAERVAEVAERLGGQLEEGPPGLLVLRKREPTPPGFPRRPGVARKRPLA